MNRKNRYFFACFMSALFFLPSISFSADFADSIEHGVDAGAAVIEPSLHEEPVSQEDTKVLQEGDEQNPVSEEDRLLQGINEIPVDAYSTSGEEAVTYDVPVVVNDRVEMFIKYFQTRGRKHFVRWLSRSQRYLPMLREVFRQNDLPEDLVYLAFIESGLNPQAKSRAKAVGMWQFIKWTGKKYGLTIDAWVDERKDPEKATLAAAQYLKDLYGMFNSWHLAAASYNAGEGRVMRAIKKHRTDDFWIVAKQKKALKRETREYIPKFIAALLIAKEPAKYGFTDVEYLPSLPYEKVSIPGATDLKVIARACECSVNEVRELNPELLRWFTPPNYPQYEVKIPAGKAEIFRTNFAAIPSGQRFSLIVHRIKKGETIAAIARKYGVTGDIISNVNNLNKKIRNLRTGTEIIVPVPDNGKPVKKA